MQHRQDPAWLQAQYDNRARVPDHAKHFERWASASALTRERSRAVLDVAYGDGKREKLDVFPPARTTPAAAPVLVFIHGGYWRSLQKDQFSFVAASFNAEGALVVVPEYDLCPQVSIEIIVLQMARAVLWTWRHAAAHGGDPSRIVVAGHSAGGHLAAMMLSCRWRELDEQAPAQLVGAAVSISGLYDLEPLRHTAFLQADLKLTPASVARASPAFFPRPKGRLVTVAGGAESEEFLRQNQLIRDVWGPTAVPVCETIAGADHFSVLKHLADPQSGLHAHTKRLLGL